MKVYIVQINSQVMPIAYVSIKAICKEFELNYSSASKGKRIFVGENFLLPRVIQITKCEVIKIKGRENNAKKKAK